MSVPPAPSFLSGLWLSVISPTQPEAPAVNSAECGIDLAMMSSDSTRGEYTVINEACPGAEWNIMCRECCEYDQIECVCPGRKEVVGYTIPCCRNEENECDSCLIHPGCTIFDNCKTCRNGSWGGTLDDFYVKGIYCAECRAGWYGGDCMRCGQVLQAPKGQILLESYPLNAHCEWTIHAKPGFNIQLRFVMLSLEFDYMCQYDYVEVRDGDNSDGQIIKRFCGNDRPAPIQSTGPSLHVLFHSDGSKNFDGFHAIFEEITALSKQKLQGVPTKKPLLPFGDLPAGYQHLHTQLQYECISPFYRRLGSSRRTCLKTGKWSGRAPSCIPICGKIENITASKTQGTRWPWQAAIYRRTSGVHGGSLHKGAWFLVCSGALVNERTVVVAAHCVTDLGKVTVIKTADLKVVLGKFYRDDDRDEKTIQNLRISAVILHPNYDPILLDSDMAILKLLDKARISTRVQPICLAATRDLTTSFQESHITVAGWNILADVRTPGFKNDSLHSGVVSVVDSLLCEEQHEDHGIPVSVTDNMFCASQDPTAPSDICLAETGGIAALSFPGRASPEPRWHLVGLVSWSYDKTCSRSLYTAFTKVLPFKDWIERNMK
ncbi:PREDICTED: inactive serine protease PAMR1 [Chrysochloris asiatica]|uniref:Inactive serine protease PAMR1 n=1 Tax=Chrysochloris asiatica TaxID=185453 RepID=A0A9B0WS57_CHRAS|nr:PREDICTED: inactive serine protease PAMR1 [Chrysochloris asiatica]